jgi:hypothetical protein
MKVKWMDLLNVENCVFKKNQTEAILKYTFLKENWVQKSSTVCRENI